MSHILSFAVFKVPVPRHVPVIYEVPVDRPFPVEKKVIVEKPVPVTKEGTAKHAYVCYKQYLISLYA